MRVVAGAMALCWALGCAGFEPAGGADAGGALAEQEELATGDPFPRPERIPLGEPFALAVLPDTQRYAKHYPEIYAAQTRWLAEVADDENLRLVVQIGDLVEGSWRIDQWWVARAAFGFLDDRVPYVVVPGNHDYGAIHKEHNARTRSTNLHQFFPRSRFEGMPTFGGFYPEGDRVDSSYHTFHAGGYDWIVIALEFAPRREVVAWANAVLDEHPDHIAIVATHAYLYQDGRRYDHARYGDAQRYNPYRYGIADDGNVTDGQGLWDKLVSRHPNILAVVCGHALGDGLAYSVQTGANDVHEMLANYQMNDLGGEGYLRLLRFDPETYTVQVTTYSPWLDEHKTDPDNELSFSYAPHAAAVRPIH